MIKLFLFQFILLSLCIKLTTSDSPDFRLNSIEICKPEQIHIAFGKSPSSLAIQWTTQDLAQVLTPDEDQSPNFQWVNCSQSGSWVMYREVGKRQFKIVQGTQNLVQDSGSAKRKWMQHLVHIDDLKASRVYEYMVGSMTQGWSTLIKFRSPHSKQTLEFNLPQRFIVVGDIGYTNSPTIPMMQLETAIRNYDAVIGVGDYGYDLDTKDGKVGDYFMNVMEPIASRIPFMPAVGNHEQAYNFLHFTERFRLLPSTQGQVITDNGPAPNNWYYSFNAGLVHFAIISTELYFMKDIKYKNYLYQQYQWLKQDLEFANKNRKNIPWIIVVGHRPMYCTTDSDCDDDASLIRDGFLINDQQVLGLEELLYQNRVDLYLSGHQHNYERMYDIYQNKTTQSTRNPRGIWHIIIGSGGNNEYPWMRKEFLRPQAEWDAFRSITFGYSKMSIYNQTHLNWQQIQTDPLNPLSNHHEGTKIDDVWLVRDTSRD